MSRHDYDHAAAFAIYLTLEPPNRTYAEVARRMGCSATSVERWARTLKWAEKLQAADERAMAKSLKTREQRVADVLKLTDGLVDHFLVNQAPKAEAATFLDVERMVKLSELLVGEATDRVSLSEAQSFLQLVFAAALDWAGRDVPASERRAGLKGAIDELVAGIATEGGEGGA